MWIVTNFCYCLIKGYSKLVIYYTSKCMSHFTVLFLLRTCKYVFMNKSISLEEGHNNCDHFNESNSLCSSMRSVIITLWQSLCVDLYSYMCLYVIRNVMFVWYDVTIYFLFITCNFYFRFCGEFRESADTFASIHEKKPTVTRIMLTGILLLQFQTFTIAGKTGRSSLSTSTWDTAWTLWNCQVPQQKPIESKDNSFSDRRTVWVASKVEHWSKNTNNFWWQTMVGEAAFRIHKS